MDDVGRDPNGPEFEVMVAALVQEGKLDQVTARWTCGFRILLVVVSVQAVDQLSIEVRSGGF